MKITIKQIFVFPTPGGSEIIFALGSDDKIYKWDFDSARWVGWFGGGSRHIIKV